MGEELFSFLCSSVGLIKNKAFEDKTGWDFLVEFPLEVNPDQTQDFSLPAIECKIQVKASDDQKRKVQIELSNLKRLVFTQMPVFFFFIEFDGELEAQSVYVVHFGKDLIAATLKRLRQVKDAKLLNKQTMVVRYSQRNKLETITGRALLGSIKKYVGRDAFNYVAKKNAFVRRVGFEEGSAIITFNTKDDTEVSDLIDLSLGLKNSVKIHAVKGWRTRFGIKDNVEFLNESEAIISISDVKPITKAILTLRGKGLGAPHYSFNCDVFVSDFSRSSSENCYTRIRIKSDFFNLVFDFISEQGSISYELNYDKIYSPSELKNVIQALMLLSKNKIELRLEFEFDAFFKHLSLPILVEKGAENKWSEYFEDYKRLMGIFQEFEIDTKIELTINDFLQNRHRLEIFQCFDKQKEKKMQISFLSQDKLLGEKVFLIFVLSLQIGSYRFGYIYTGESIVDAFEEHNDKSPNYIFEVTNFETKMFSYRRNKQTEQELLSEIEAVKNEYDDKGYFTVVQPQVVIDEIKDYIKSIDIN